MAAGTQTNYPVRAYYGLNPIIVNFLESSAGAFSKDEFVTTNTDGLLVIASTGVILGIAKKTATGTANTVIPVELINFNELYVMYSGGTPAQAQVGLMVDITFTTTAQKAGATGGDNDDAIIVALHPDDTPAAGTRVLVRIRPDKCLGISD